MFNDRLIHPLSELPILFAEILFVFFVSENLITGFNFQVQGHWYFFEKYDNFDDNDDDDPDEKFTQKLLLYATFSLLSQF